MTSNDTSQSGGHERLNHSSPIGDTRIAMTVREAIAASGIGKTTIYGLMRDGDLPRVKVGQRTLIRRDDLNRVLQSESTTATRLGSTAH